MWSLLVPVDEKRWWFRRALYIVLVLFGALVTALVVVG